MLGLFLGIDPTNVTVILFPSQKEVTLTLMLYNVTQNTPLKAYRYTNPPISRFTDNSALNRYLQLSMPAFNLSLIGDLVKSKCWRCVRLGKIVSLTIESQVLFQSQVRSHLY